MEPDDIADLKLWLKADAITGVADGADLITWVDSSGLGNDAVEMVAANSPIYETNELNGLPIVRFSDSSNCAMDPPVGVTGECTIIYVGRQNTAVSASRRAIASGSGNWLMGPYSGQWQWFNGSTFADPGPVSTDQAWIIHALRRGLVNGTHYVYALTSEAAPFSDVNGAGNNPGDITLGGFPSGEAYAGDMAEVIAYDSLITEVELEGLVAYLRFKWAAVGPDPDPPIPPDPVIPDNNRMGGEGAIRHSPR